MLSLLQELKQQEKITMADYYFAKLIAEKQQAFNYPETIQNLAIFLAALCHYEQQKGHTCLPLNAQLFRSAFDLAYDEQHYLAKIQEKIGYLPLADNGQQWQQALANHIAFTVQPFEKQAPLAFQFNALYMYRTWQDEYRIAHYFQQSATKQNNENLKINAIKQALETFFPAEHCQCSPGEKHPWQKLAVATAIDKNFCLITGGPGTGKTTTVTRLLLALQSLHQGKLQIKLVAPTGKAAARLTESIYKSIQDLQTREGIQISAQLNHQIPKQAETLHRLLGTSYYSSKTRYNQENLLDVDVLVVDEASMIDLSLMAKLLQALKPTTKLILLGDKDQLASVEAGAILAELGKFQQQGYSQQHTEYLFATTNEKLPYQEQGVRIRDNLCHLVASRRFGHHSYIGKLANAINQCRVQETFNLFQQASLDLNGKNEAEIEIFYFDHFYDQNTSQEQNRQQCVKFVVEQAVTQYRHYLKLIQQVLEEKRPIKECINDIFAAFNQVRFLTALRVGPLGSETLNQLIAERLRQKGLLHFENTRESYIGKPVMITQNDANVGLYNGDIGLYLAEQDAEGKLHARYWFENGQSELASRLPNNELAFAMTVHKSQGSEFEHTFLILPIEANPVLSKELVYTGVTRAKKQLTVFASQGSWKAAISRKTARQSGLGDWFKNWQ